MGDRKIPHVEDIFANQDGGRNVKSRVSEIEQKTAMFSFKNKQAPLPPGGYVPLPKIGNYQPKMLMRQTSSEYSYKVDNGGNPLNGDAHIDHSSHLTSTRQEMIIGDKDIPIVLENKHYDDDDQPMAAPRRKRRAPSAPGERSNSDYGRSFSERSDEARFEMDMDMQGGDIDFGPGIDNPSFSERESRTRDYHHRDQRKPEVQQNGDGKNVPYIPAPDYEDDEMTMTFGDERDEFSDHRNKRTSIYKEYEGDDFGVYLQDEEEYLPDRNTHSLQRRGNFSKSKSAPQPPHRSHKHTDNRFSKPKKSKKDLANKRNTIRDFTFSDSKMGWGDRSVKSTSAKGRYIKREKEKDRTRIDQKSTFEQQTLDPAPGSYEEFLRVRNGSNLPLESPSSSDSGVDVGLDQRQRDMYYQGQPKQLRNGKYDQKPSLWRRLTWRFKKSVDLSRMEYR